MASRASAVSTLHARLRLPASFPHKTLERCLVDKTVPGKPNNVDLAVHGNYVLGYYISDYLMTRYPRLPYKVLKNALISYVGWKTLASVGKGWGVEGSPKEEMTVRPNPSKPTKPGRAPTADELDAMLQLNRVKSVVKSGRTKGARDETEESPSQYLDRAYSEFVRAVVAGVDLHTGPAGVRQFIDHHFLSRRTDLIRSFRVSQPQRELSVLCARQGLERPVTRLIAETGRRSNSPVFVVGVYSGNDKLGEGQASSLKEAEFLAQSNAMKAWYLFEDRTATLPFLTAEENFEGTTLRPAMVDLGDVIV